MNSAFWRRVVGAFTILILAFLSSCTDTLERSEVVYDNDFSNLDLAGFENGKLFIFQNDTIAGFYHNEEVSVQLENLPSHNMLKVTTEILIHDSWDGNPEDGVSGPDYWFFGLDNTEIFRTTFSNSPCESTFCLYQSYPNSYFRQNRPKEGAIQTNMPGLCLFGAFSNYTTRYRIEEIIPHSNNSVKIFWNSELRQEENPNPACDESWSLARVTVEAFVVN
ncbi:hypothetical protein [Algoriphagus marincola]|jgi:hypothetical protein|uniref:hypothetical protein n=1 Tax=Algoriphagus marincola TaxID=264027 RepID=UPI000479116D|nr:hypothetical protein [Algoriphagus marincola]